MIEVNEVSRKPGRPRIHPSESKAETVKERVARLKRNGYRVIGRVELNPNAAAALDILLKNDRYIHIALERALLLAVNSDTGDHERN